MIRRGFILLLIAALLGALVFIFRDVFRSGEVRELRLPADLARHYAEAERETGVSWAYLAAIDEVESGYEQATPASIRETGCIGYRERTEGNSDSESDGTGDSQRISGRTGRRRSWRSPNRTGGWFRLWPRNTPFPFGKRIEVASPIRIPGEPAGPTAAIGNTKEPT